MSILENMASIASACSFVSKNTDFPPVVKTGFPMIRNIGAGEHQGNSLNRDHFVPIVVVIATRPKADLI